MEVTPEIRTPRDSAARTFYLAYLNSPSWRITRNHALRRAQYRCERCGASRNLQVHHKSYERLGREWDQDLEVLCEGCHDQHHAVKQAQTGDSIRIYLKLVGMTMHDKSITTFADLSEAVKKQCATLHIPYDSDRIGQAIALATGKAKPRASVREHEDLVVSHEPINKADALRIMFSLSERQREQPVIRTMPSSPSRIDIYGPIPREGVEHDRY